MDADSSMVSAGGEGGGRGSRGIDGDGRRLTRAGAHHTGCRWCVVELYSWNLCNIVNQCHPHEVNKKKNTAKKAKGRHFSFIYTRLVLLSYLSSLRIQWNIC